MRHELHTEKLVALPKRYETAFFAFRSFNQNNAAVYQSNASTQIQGLGVIAAQNSVQANASLIAQSQ